MPDDFRRHQSVSDESPLVQHFLDPRGAWKAPFAEPVQSHKGMRHIEALGNGALDPAAIDRNFNAPPFHLADDSFGSPFQQDANAFRVFPKARLAIPLQDSSDVMSGKAGVHAIGNPQYRLATSKSDILCPCRSEEHTSELQSLRHL